MKPITKSEATVAAIAIVAGPVVGFVLSVALVAAIFMGVM